MLDWYHIGDWSLTKWQTSDYFNYSLIICHFEDDPKDINVKEKKHACQSEAIFNQ